MPETNPPGIYPGQNAPEMPGRPQNEPEMPQRRGRPGRRGDHPRPLLRELLAR